MQWGIVFASTAFPEPDRAIAMAQAAEQAGFESLWCPEHVVVATGEGATPYGGSVDGKMDRLWKRGGIPDPIVWLSFVAAHTSTIRLGTNVVVVPEHQPAVLAKSVATLDVLSRVASSSGSASASSRRSTRPSAWPSPTGATHGRVHRGDASALAGGGGHLPRALRHARLGAVRPQPVPRHRAPPRRWRLARSDSPRRCATAMATSRGSARCSISTRPWRG